MTGSTFASRALADLDAAHARIAAKGAETIEDGKPKAARDTMRVLAKLDRLRAMARRDVEGERSEQATATEASGRTPRNHHVGIERCAKESIGMQTTERNSMGMNGIEPKGREHSEMQVERFLVTPRIAQDWMTSKNSRNRPPRKSVIREYAKAMERGEWAENAETIKFAPDGLLLDGQHRLAAVIESGCPVWFLIAWDVPASTFDTIDRGAKRTAADSFALRSVNGAASVAASLRLLHIYSSTGHFQTPATPPTAHQLLELADARPEWVEWIGDSRTIRRQARFVTPSLFSALYCIFSDIDGEAANDFMVRLADGTALLATNPIYAARRRLMKETLFGRASGRYLDEQAAIIIKAWNLYREGKDMSRIQWTRAEKFPQPR